jgi:hypothetical protein
MVLLFVDTGKEVTCSLHLVTVLQTEAVGSHILDITQLYASVVLAHIQTIYIINSHDKKKKHTLFIGTFVAFSQ